MTRLEHSAPTLGEDVEGESDAALAPVKRCHEGMYELGGPRIDANLERGPRIDHAQGISDEPLSVPARVQR